MTEINNPANQSLARELTAVERGLADALFQVFATGAHDFADVANALRNNRVAAPSGDTSPWTKEKLERELKLINKSMDDAYRGNLPDHIRVF